MNDCTANPSLQRLFFLDNLRYFIVLCVIVLHAALAYSKLTPWWPVLEGDPGKTGIFDVIVLITDVFIMPIMFFIAGFFALKSIRKKGGWLFVRSKLTRIGIPLLAGATVIVPVIGYIYEYFRSTDAVSSGYAAYWSTYLKGFGDFYVGYITSYAQPSHNYFWFLSLLFWFFVVFACLYAIKAKWFGHKSVIPEPKDSSALPVLLGLGVATGMSLVIMVPLFTVNGHEPWVIIANLVQFQPTRLFLYVFYFPAGIYAAWKGWFSNGKAVGRLRIWLPVCLAMMVFFLGSVQKMGGGTTPSLPVLLVYCFSRAFLCLSIFMVLISFAYRYWNRDSKINRSLAANSYGIYILHMPIVLGLGLVLLSWAGVPVIIKFCIVTAASTLLSWGISRVALKPAGL
ncbi:membrane protein, putative [Syntrophotalea carbinolica DSM 2380]|uniref:Membrane protein, putative n=1 Tax=Syntrophotalea carbinolica (strain DSM 2380 / NBRC 103641 / GraBd1) TaxID=338963 RepID=Q3A764_SYNC1|nr:acyltransferase family protein [Syntrophotalea carbinolica]ABA87783.1 membrane protein, putative [Syntrophotalea carbinolica DSM 2380]